MYRIRDILSIDAEMQRSKQSSDCQNVAQPCKSNNHNFLSSDRLWPPSRWLLQSSSNQSLIVFEPSAPSLLLSSTLGCKFRRNSGRNSQIPFRFGDFASGTTKKLKWKFRISPVFFHYVTLANRPFCTTPPLRSVPRPIGEGLSIAFWASRLSETLFSRKLTLSNFKLSFELKKKHRKWPEHRRTSGGISVRNLVPGARLIVIPPEFAT